LSPEGPLVTIELTPSFPAVPGQSVLIHPIADSLAEITSLTITVDGVPLALDGQGRAEFIPIQPGRYLVEAVAADADGRNGTANIILKVRDPDDNYAPVVSFGLNYSANYAFTATAWPGELVVMNSQAYDTVAQIPLEDTLLDPSGDAFGVVITPDGSRAYVLLRKSIAVVDTMALQRIDAIWQTSQIDNIMLPEGANTHSFTIDPTGDYIYVSDVVQSVIYQISVNPADKGFYNTCVALFNLSLPVAGLRGLDVTSDGKRLYVASPYSYVGWNGSSFDGKIVVVDVDQDADPNGFNIGLELGEINLGYHKKPTGINADSGNPYLITYTDMEGGFGLIIASENDIGKVEREILIDNEGMEIAILPGNTLGGKFAGHSTYAFITGFKSELNRPDCPAGGNIVIIKDPFKAGAKVVGFTRPIPYGLPAGLAVSPDGQNLYVTYQRPDSIFVFSIPAILEQIKASEGKTIDNIGTPRLSYYPVNNWTQDEWLANAAIDIKADYRMDVPFLEDAGHDNTFQVHDENRAPISLAGSPWGIAVLQDIDTELKPVVDGVGDHLFFKNGDSFTFNLENDTAEGVGSNGNIVFVIDIEGPYKQFISFSVGTNEVAIEPSDEIVFAPQEQLKLTVTMKNIIAKNYNYDQLFGVVITIKAFAQRGAQDVLLEKSMCIIRFVSVTDPSGYTRYARFMKSLNDGPDKFVREKTIEYHLPQNMETTFQKGTTQWDSTDMFILPDGPFVGEGSMAWKFDPTENGSRAM
jgi:DNA-binding beta-propeller fold protein YncE